MHTYTLTFYTHTHIYINIHKNIDAGRTINSMNHTTFTHIQYILSPRTYVVKPQRALFISGQRLIIRWYAIFEGNKLYSIVSLLLRSAYLDLGVGRWGGEGPAASDYS